MTYNKLRGQDLNLRPRGYEPRELPGCSTPHKYVSETGMRVEAYFSFSTSSWIAGVVGGSRASRQSQIHRYLNHPTAERLQTKRFRHLLPN